MRCFPFCRARLIRRLISLIGAGFAYGRKSPSIVVTIFASRFAEHRVYNSNGIVQCAFQNNTTPRRLHGNLTLRSRRQWHVMKADQRTSASANDRLGFISPRSNCVAVLPQEADPDVAKLSMCRSGRAVTIHIAMASSSFQWTLPIEATYRQTCRR